MKRPDLILTSSADSLFAVDPEDNGLVAVERQRFSIMLMATGEWASCNQRRIQPHQIGGASGGPQRHQ